MKRSFAIVLAFALLFGGLPVFAASPSQASQQLGQASGSVRDQAGAPVPGHAVRIRNSATGQVLGTGTTGSDGGFIFSNLPPGAYVVEAVDAQGNVAAVSAMLSIEAGKPAVAGVIVTLKGDEAAAAAAGGSFFTSPKGLVIMAAAVAAGGAGIVALKGDKKAKSPHK